MPHPLPPCATLEISLAAIVDNYRQLSAKLKNGRCAAVVKANAYGLGVEAVAPALTYAGCDTFFVATLEEGIALRTAFTINHQPSTTIHIINGVAKGEEKDFLAHNLSPVLNSMEQLKRWGEKVSSFRFQVLAKHSDKAETSNLKPETSVLHLDTGMNRLGLSPRDVESLALTPGLLKKANVGMYMSHLACADMPKHAQNQAQLKQLRGYLAQLPKLPVSFANSSGIFLGRDYHFDLARPGCALYGITPTPGRKNPMKQVATLSAPILQIREITKRESIGYDATYYAKKGDRIATVGLGYADGYFRSLSNKGVAHVAGIACPIIGRVSMDMVMLDVTRIPAKKLASTTRAEFIGKHQSVDALADAAKTIGYEVFTRLGRRVRRIFT